MNLTKQQALVLFDIAKKAMSQKNGFAGYSNETIKTLVNNIISQQNNTEYINLIKPTTKEIIKETQKTNTNYDKDTTDDWTW